MNKKKNDLEEKGLRGNIKYIEEKNYFASKEPQSMEDDELYSYSLTSFNKDGNILKHIYKTEDLDEFCTYKYDSNGKIIKRSEYDGEDESLFGTEIFIHDQNGNIIENDRYNSIGEFTYKDMYKYDSNGNKIEQNFYNSNGLLIKRLNSIYNSNGNEIEYKYYDSNEILEIKGTFKYDSRGNKIESIYYDSDESIYRRECFKYDEYGNIIENAYFDYKEQSNLSLFFEYELDNKNNWIKQFLIQGGKRKIVWERKIIYYGDKDENSYPHWDLPSYEGIEIQ